MVLAAAMSMSHPVENFLARIGAWCCHRAHEMETRRLPRCIDCECPYDPDDGCFVCRESIQRDREWEAAYHEGGQDAWQEARRAFERYD